MNQTIMVTTCIVLLAPPTYKGEVGGATEKEGHTHTVQPVVAMAGK